MKKKIIFILIPILILTVTLITGTYSYFRSSETFTGSIDPSKYRVEIIEDYLESWNGNKKVSFKNTGENNVYLRISYNEIWESNMNNKLNGNDIVTKKWTNIFINDFTEIDGWYYYNKVLKKDDEILVLDGIILNNDKYKEYDYELNFNYETVADKPRSSEAVWGIKPDVDGLGSVIWKR